MKKVLLTLFIGGLLVACTSTQEKEMDGTAGASLNRADTIAQYEALSEKIELITGDKEATPEELAEVQKEIKEFQAYLSDYQEATSPGAKKYIDDYFIFENRDDSRRND